MASEGIAAAVDAADLSVAEAVERLLRQIPEIWAEYDSAGLTHAEENALFLLVAAGMVERRSRLRARMTGSDAYFEMTVTATGEGGIADALEPFCASCWHRWADAWTAWSRGEASASSPVVFTWIPPDAWRLTDQGVLARGDFAEGQPKYPLAFVLKRGFHANRPPVRGSGRMVELNEHGPAKVSGSVNVGNWPEGAQAFAAALLPELMAALKAGRGPESECPTGHEKKSRKSPAKHVWCPEALACADAYRKLIDSKDFATLREHCESFAVDSGTKATGETLYKKLTAHRSEWDAAGRYSNLRQPSVRRTRRGR